MRSRIEYAVGLVVFLVGALLEAAHYFELIERLIPAWLAPLINERVNFGLMIVGLLIFLLAFFKRRLGHSDDPNGNGHRLSPLPPASPAAAKIVTENTGNISSTGGSSTASVGGIHIYHYTPPLVPLPSAIPREPGPTHNVKFERVRVGG
jgi:hypothetical protein